MKATKRTISKRTEQTERLRAVRVATCGELPTACDFLHRIGVVQIDRYSDAVNLGRASDYHLILVYAPQGEGLFDTYCRGVASSSDIPIRLLNEPCCHSALVEIGMTVEDIARELVRSDG